MKNYLSTNSKLKRSGIFSWGIPAYRAADGFLTCPGAKTCIAGCYASAGFYVMPSVKHAQEERLALSKTSDFVGTISTEIKRRKIRMLRVHDSGDFYSVKYLQKWVAIMKENPQTQFYAYTKMVPFFLIRDNIPDNFQVIYSYGGKFDKSINPEKDRHSAIFPSLEALKAAGYADSSHYDSVAASGQNHRIGLLYHGPKSKTFTAGAA